MGSHYERDLGSVDMEKHCHGNQMTKMSALTQEHILACSRIQYRSTYDFTR